MAIKAELSNKARGLKLGETLQWSWDLMIGGITLNLKELEVLEKKQSPLVNHKGSRIELRPNDLKNAANFCASQKNLSLDDALRLTAVEGSTLMKMPIHHFDAGPKLQQVLELHKTCKQLLQKKLK